MYASAPSGYKEVMATGGGRAKRNAGKTLLDFNFVKKKKTTEDSEGIFRNDEQGKC